MKQSTLVDRLKGEEHRRRLDPIPLALFSEFRGDESKRAGAILLNQSIYYLV